MSKNCMFSFDPEVIENFNKHCADTNKKKSPIVNDLIKDYLESITKVNRTNLEKINVKIPYSLVPRINEVIQQKEMASVGYSSIADIFKEFIKSIKMDDLRPQEISIHTDVTPPHKAQLDSYFKTVGLSMDICFMFFLLDFMVNNAE